MLYKYEATSTSGEKQSGSIDAPTMEIAIISLQRRGLIITSIKPEDEKKGFLGLGNITWFQKVKTKDVVMLSRQLATLFEAKVPVLESFKLLASESSNSILGVKLNEVVGDIQGGISMSQAMAKHPDVFSKFYVNMIKVGEESGKLDEIFSHLADYLERSYELSSKAKNALLYPAFVISTFIVILILMLVMVVPRLSVILGEVGGDLPIYTRILLGFSNFFIKAWPVVLGAIVLLGFFLWSYAKTGPGRMMFSRMRISIPYVGTVYKKIYLSRVADNLSTLIASGLPMISSLETTSEVVGNEVYKNILLETGNMVKGGSSLSDAFSQFGDIPGIITHMVKVGEEGGKLTFVLSTMARFYKREVDSLIENLVGLIEPIMIIVLGGMVAFLVMSVLGPIYSITTNI